MTQVPMARLAELVAHLLDLDCGYELDRLDQSSARWLLQWALTRYADDPRLPPLRVESTSGVTGRVGPAEAGEDARRMSVKLWTVPFPAASIHSRSVDQQTGQRYRGMKCTSSQDLQRRSTSFPSFADCQ